MAVICVGELFIEWKCCWSDGGGGGGGCGVGDRGGKSSSKGCGRGVEGGLMLLYILQEKKIG